MIKKIALICIFLLFNMVACRGLEIAPIKERSLQRTHEVNMSKTQIFDKSLEWMARTFVDSKAVIELKDRENGKIIGKGITKFFAIGPLPVDIPCRFTMIIETKDGKYRTTYENLTGFFGQYANDPGPLEHKVYVDQVKKNLVNIDNDLLTYLNSSKSSDKW